MPDWDAINTFLVDAKLENSDLPHGIRKVRRWAHLALPNGQIARSLWKEKEKYFGGLRKARNVKVISHLIYPRYTH